MLMDEALHFMRLGTFLERADNTARLVDVKFHAVHGDLFADGSEKASSTTSTTGAPFCAACRALRFTARSTAM